MKALLKSLPLGKIAYYSYYRPAHKLRDLYLAGGPLEVRKTEQGRREMEAIVDQLPPLPTGKPSEFKADIYFVTGKKYWYQTAFCFWSLALRCKDVELRPVLFDDGTFDQELEDKVLRVFPNAIIHREKDTVERLDQHLPISKYPLLRARRLDQVYTRKLFDIHPGNSGYRLFLDSDILFFHPPESLLDWLRTPTKPLFMRDCMSSYGYSTPLLESIAGGPLPKALNVGVLGLQSEALDWDWFEHTYRKLVEKEGVVYYTEQALCMLYASRNAPKVLDQGEYLCLPLKDDAKNLNAIMHHYVAESKRWYFQVTWKRIYQEILQSVD